MIKSELSVVIDAPPEKVFAGITDPAAIADNVMNDVPNAVEVKNVTGEGKGMSYLVVYKMAGVRLNTECTFIEYVPNELLTIQVKGGMDATQTWKLTPQERRTALDVTGEYSIPVPLVGRIAELMLKRQNEREWEAILANIKARIESQVQVDA